MSTRFYRNFKKTGVALFVIMLLIFPLILQTHRSNSLEAQSELSDVRVGVFNAGTNAFNSDIALWNLFEWMGATVEWLNGPAIRNGALNSLDIVAFPGGSMLSMGFNLTETGIELVRSFVASGGSYFGICGGAMFGTEFIGLCSGIWDNNIPGMSGGTHLIEMTVHQDCAGPNLSDEPTSYETLYWGSSFFRPTDPNSIMPIMSYPSNDEPGMFVGRYGSGTFFISSPHPEYEEGDPRDGTTQFDYLDDSDSEWALLQKVAQWLIEESPHNPALIGGFHPALIVVIVMAVVIVIVGVVFYYKRR